MPHDKWEQGSIICNVYVPANDSEESLREEGVNCGLVVASKRG